MPTLAAGVFHSFDRRFADVLGRRPTLERLVHADAHEGPVYAHDEHALYYTTLPQPRPHVAIERLDLRTLEVTLVRDDAGAANGMALGLDGSLIVCEQGDYIRPARLARLDRRSGEVRTIVESWGGLPLNSPNDVAVRSDGSLWFTDPSYGHLQGFRPPPQVSDHVYRFDPVSGRAYAVADCFEKPNGICFSPDEGTLYVGDSGEPRQILGFPLLGGCLLGEPFVFAEIAPGYPDGLKTDSAGRVYSSSASGVQVFDAAGAPLGQIALPGAVNFTFGGPGRNVLYVTTDDSIWAATLAATGHAFTRGA